MDSVRSLYIEFLRIIAAFYVFIFHIGSGDLDGQLYFSTPSFSENLGLSYYTAHYFVIVFFILSGYLITTSTNRPNITFRFFMISRLGRLYSVLIPALIFSFLLPVILINIGIMESSVIKSNSNILGRLILNILFLTQSWNLCSTPPFNTPFWSVNYEFMYYLLIGATLLPQFKQKVILICLVMLISGPKVILLAPVWFFGNLLYKVSNKRLLSPFVSLILFLGTISLLFTIFVSPRYIPFTKDTDNNLFFEMNLMFSWNYQADYIVGFIIALNIYSFFGISNAILSKLSSDFIEKVLYYAMKIGNCSYTLYLFHLPLLYFFVSILPYDKTNIVYQIGLIILVLVTVYFIARKTEWKVETWRNYMLKIVFQFDKIIKYLFVKS